MTDHTDVVAEVKANLLARHVDISGPCGSFAISSRVVWRLRAEGWGLIHSTGNGCDQNGERYRADTCMLKDGTTIDMLRKSESDNGDTSNPEAYNIPAWDATGNQPPANWREPFNPDANQPPGPNPEPPAGDLEARVAMLEAQVKTLVNTTAELSREIELLRKSVPKGVDSKGSLYGVRVQVNSTLTY